MTVLFSPWFWLAFLLYSAGLALVVDERATTNATNKMQVAWDHANAVAAQVRQVRVDANRKLMADAQSNADKERQNHAKEAERLRGNLVIALNGLRDRPARPGPGDQGGAPGIASPGPAGGCTGAGLYRDDAEFLTWRADAAQRIRLQRDSCYRLYDAAREAVSKLQCQ